MQLQDGLPDEAEDKVASAVVKQSLGGEGQGTCARELGMFPLVRKGLEYLSVVQ